MLSMFVFFTIEEILFTIVNIGNICLARKMLDTLRFVLCLKRSSTMGYTFTFKPYLQYDLHFGFLWKG